MLKALMEANIDARYIPDCAISAVVSTADIVVVGASAVTADGGFINRALRQCLNARIQGTAASMTFFTKFPIQKTIE